jgi:exopolyphosphatase/pppGpp-phosphohydrolase
MLMPLTNLERSQIVGMEKGRERTLPGGALILERGLYALQSEGAYVSVRGWRHALIEGGPI